MNIDYSTIRADRIAKMKPYIKPSSYHVSDSMGSACYGDPPGYPSYFIRHIYTASGNTPNRGVTSVIDYMGQYYELERADSEEPNLAWKLRRLWNPLPADHLRIIAWMRATYQHHAHCYYNPEITDKNNRDRLVIYPVGKWQLPVFKDDKRFSDSWRAAAQMEHFQRTYEIILAAVLVVDPDNHAAVQLIRRFYPDHKPVMFWIKYPPKMRGNWWELFAENPGSDNCPGEIAWGRGNYKHPINGKWCQVCGWSQEQEIADRIRREAEHMNDYPRNYQTYCAVCDAPLTVDGITWADNQGRCASCSPLEKD